MIYNEVNSVMKFYQAGLRDLIGFPDAKFKQ
jgi:hypothetical protein